MNEEKKDNLLTKKNTDEELLDANFLPADHKLL